MVGRKIYYELATGDVILITPEKHSENAANTTEEQDFEIFDVLQARNPETVGVIQLEYGQYRGDFELANGVRVDLETGKICFNYPVFEPPIATEVQNLRTENQALVTQNGALQQRITELESQNAQMLLALVEGGLM